MAVTLASNLVKCNISSLLDRGCKNGQAKVLKPLEQRILSKSGRPRASLWSFRMPCSHLLSVEPRTTFSGTTAISMIQPERMHKAKQTNIQLDELDAKLSRTWCPDFLATWNFREASPTNHTKRLFWGSLQGLLTPSSLPCKAFSANRGCKNEEKEKSWGQWKLQILQSQVLELGSNMPPRRASPQAMRFTLPPLGGTWNQVHKRTKDANGRNGKVRHENEAQGVSWFPPCALNLPSAIISCRLYWSSSDFPFRQQFYNSSDSNSSWLRVYPTQPTLVQPLERSPTHKRNQLIPPLWFLYQSILPLHHDLNTTHHFLLLSRANSSKTAQKYAFRCQQNLAVWGSCPKGIPGPK